MCISGNESEMMCEMDENEIEIRPEDIDNDSELEDMDADQHHERHYTNEANRQHEVHYTNDAARMHETHYTNETSRQHETHYANETSRQHETHYANETSRHHEGHYGGEGNVYAEQNVAKDEMYDEEHLHQVEGLFKFYLSHYFAFLSPCEKFPIIYNLHSLAHNMKNFLFLMEFFYFYYIYRIFPGPLAFFKKAVERVNSEKNILNSSVECVE